MHHLKIIAHCAITMKSGKLSAADFGDSWRDPAVGEEQRMLAVLTY